MKIIKLLVVCILLGNGLISCSINDDLEELSIQNTGGDDEDDPVEPDTSGVMNTPTISMVFLRTSNGEEDLDDPVAPEKGN